MHVTNVVRLTQNNSTTIGYACAAARILEQVILSGVQGREAVDLAVQSMLASGQRQDAQIANDIVELQELQDMPYLDAVKMFSGGQYNAVTVS